MQTLEEHRLDNTFATSPMEVRRCRVAFGPLTEEQRREVTALIEGQGLPSAPLFAPAAG
ncbi:MAG: hypothetical protein M0017_02235 [Desulfobacteraceae bacterium]|nr:hypothetical protein [Desulfobacteraceae bacterium]